MRVSSSRMGITISSGYIPHPRPRWPFLFYNLRLSQSHFTKLESVRCMGIALHLSPFHPTELDLRK
jgi:hypothetical protein